jgi:hypothetical protein
MSKSTAEIRQAFLALVLAEENIFELVHSGVGKQQRRIVIRYEGAAGYNRGKDGTFVSVIPGYI